MRKTKSDTKSEAFDKIKQANQKLKAENRQLKKQLKSAQKELDKLLAHQESYQFQLEQEEIDDYSRKIKCKKCKSDNLEVIEAGIYLIKICNNCNYRNKTKKP